MPVFKEFSLIFYCKPDYPYYCSILLPNSFCYITKTVQSKHRLSLFPSRFWYWTRPRRPWTLRRMTWCRPPSGGSSRTAPCSPSPTGSTPSWTTTGSLFWIRAKLPSLTHRTIYWLGKIQYSMAWHAMQDLFRRKCWCIRFYIFWYLFCFRNK